MLDPRPTRSAPPALVPSEECFCLRDGRTVLLRPARPDDASRLAHLCERLSAESSRLRFFRAGRRLTAAEALDVASVDRTHNEAILALAGEEVVAWGSFYQLGDQPHAEMTLVVDDAYQGGGLGREVLMQLITAARERDYTMLLAELMPDNDRMLGLVESAGLPCFADEYFGVVRVHVFLQRDTL